MTTVRTFNLGSGSSVNITQPSGGVTTLQNMSGGIKPPTPVIVTPR